jgi:hypothetical protein
MNFDFVEIGTSNFDTLIQDADENTYGITIEPVKEYLECLPNPKNVIKLNCAVSFDKSLNDIDLYHIKQEIIKENKLKKFLRGCNCIGKYHPMHIKYDLQHLVTITRIKQINLEYLITKYNVESINYLKIDTEGGDCEILKELAELIELNRVEKPKRIKFETNSLTPDNKIDETIKKYKDFGYKENRKKSDTVLFL